MTDIPYGSLFTTLVAQKDDLIEDRCCELFNLYFHPLRTAEYHHGSVDAYFAKQEMFTPGLEKDMLTVLIRLFRNRSTRNSSRRLITKPFMIAWRDFPRTGLNGTIRQREVQQMVNFVHLVLYAHYWKLTDVFDSIRGWDGKSKNPEVIPLAGMLMDRIRDRYRTLMPFFVTSDILAAQEQLQHLRIEFVFTQYGIHVRGERQIVVNNVVRNGITKELDVFLPAPNAGYPIDLFDAHL